MNNDGPGADLRRWVWFIIFELIGGAFLAADARKDVLIFAYSIGDLPQAGVLMKYKIIAEYTLFAVATLLGLVKLLFLQSTKSKSSRYSSTFPWWCGR